MKGKDWREGILGENSSEELMSSAPVVNPTPPFLL